MEGDSASPASFELGDFIFKPNYNLQKNSLIKGYGLIIRISDDEFIVSANACHVGYEFADSRKSNSQLLSVEEGNFVIPATCVVVDGEINSAHFPFFEEPEKFCMQFEKIVKDKNRTQHGI